MHMIHNTEAGGTGSALPPVLALALALILTLMVGGGFGWWPLGTPAQAASLAASSASSAVGSVSTSVGAFSHAVVALSTSSVPGGKPVAQGLYRIEQLQALPPAPQQRLAIDLWPADLQTGDARQPWQLRVPTQTAASAGLQQGQVLEVREQPYGWSVRSAGAAVPFYWVLHDEWALALSPRPVQIPAPAPASSSVPSH